MDSQIWKVISSLFPHAQCFEDDFIQVDGFPEGMGLQCYPENRFGWVQLDVCMYHNGRIIEDHVEFTTVDSAEEYLRGYANIK